MTKLPPVHPGEVLLEDFMKPMGLTQYRLAKELKVASLPISQVLRGKRALTAEKALGKKIQQEVKHRKAA